VIVKYEVYRGAYLFYAPLLLFEIELIDFPLKIERVGMPVYEFVCKDCGSKFEELFLKMSDRDSDVECPSCKGENVE